MSDTYQNMSTKVDTFYSATTDYSVNNSICTDSQICSNKMMSTETDNSINFLIPSLDSENLECLDNLTSIDYDGGDLFDDLDLGPIARNRCNTWPIRNPTEFQPNNPLFMRENTLYDQNSNQVSVNLTAQGAYIDNYQQKQEFNLDSPTAQNSNSNSHKSCDEDEIQDGQQKRSQTRRNAWGNMSYAELITQAIMSSPEKRLTLSNIYEWMVENVPYFSDKGESMSSAGWKNSIRHNLSLHSRFMRVQNEGTGKSSWWTMNPQAKKSHSSRRRPTMDTTTKSFSDKKKKGVKKRAEMQSSIGIHRNCTNENPNSFRPRTQSNILIPDRNQILPTFNPNINEFNFKQWIPNNTSVQVNLCYTNNIMNRTDQISSLNSNNPIKQMDVQPQSIYYRVLKSMCSVEQQSRQVNIHPFGFNQVAKPN